jgi:hypothetical protein
MTPKYTTPMMIGVVTLDIATAMPIHSRYTGLSVSGKVAPSKISTAPIEPQTSADRL